MESSLIRWLRQRLPGHDHLAIGPGDDAAVLRWSADADCVVTVDVLMDGTDFELDKIDPRRAGHKALAVNLSDLAAMAATPLSAVIGLVLPSQGGEQLAHALYEGLLPLAERYGVSIAGGDVNAWNGPLVISVTAIGKAQSERVWRRSGARAGDWIVATGEFGGSILGHHLDFEPRVREAQQLSANYQIRAAIDVSDGLSLDVAHIAEASGCGYVLHEAQLPVAAAANELTRRQPSTSALTHALQDGEDFELVLAIAPDEARRLLHEQPLAVPLTKIGEFTQERGYWLVRADGQQVELQPRGFEHRLEG